MEEDDPEKEKKIPNAMKSAAAIMAADILVLLGFIFLLFGIAKFLTGFFGIEGIGEGAVGMALLIIGFLIIMRSRMKIKFATMPLERTGAAPPSSEAPSESYR